MITTSSTSSTFAVQLGKLDHYRATHIPALAAIVWRAASRDRACSLKLRGLSQHSCSFTAYVSLQVYASDAQPIYVIVEFEESGRFAVKPDNLLGHPDGYAVMAELEEYLNSTSDTLHANLRQWSSAGTPPSVPIWNALLYAGGLVVSGNSGWFDEIDWSAKRPSVHLRGSNSTFEVDNSRTPVLWARKNGGWNSGVPMSLEILQMRDILEKLCTSANPL
jgi:hypothetical protein